LWFGCKLTIHEYLRKSQSFITNFGDKRYFEKLGAELGEVTDWIKELGHSKRIKNYKVMCPNRLLKMGEDDERADKRVRTYWDADPVHLCADGYRQLARTLLEKVAVVAEQAAELQQHQQQAAHSSRKRTNVGRPDWTDDAVGGPPRWHHSELQMEGEVATTTPGEAAVAAHRNEAAEVDDQAPVAGTAGAAVRDIDHISLTWLKTILYYM
jgi:hypothetical protein